MITSPLRFFGVSEFSHPELVADDAAQLLDTGRGFYGKPVTLTSDGRPIEEEIAALKAAPEEAGKSDDELTAIAKGSLHVQGRAFDLRWPEAAEDRYALAWAYLKLAFVRNIVIEFEPVPTHLHIGFFPTGTPHGSRLIFG